MRQDTVLLSLSRYNLKPDIKMVQSSMINYLLEYLKLPVSLESLKPPGEGCCSILKANFCPTSLPSSVASDCFAEDNGRKLCCRQDLAGRCYRATAFLCLGCSDAVTAPCPGNRKQLMLAGRPVGGDYCHEWRGLSSL